jgi:hypothetical protein
MPIHGHSTGRRATGYQCPLLDKWLARKIPPEHAALYREAMEAIDNLLPHHGERSDTISHGMPTQDDLNEITLIEQALALADIEISISGIYRYIRETQANAA